MNYLTAANRLAFYQDTIKNPQWRSQRHELEPLQNDNDDFLLTARER